MNLDTAQGPILYLDGVTVSFDGFKALDSLSLIVDPGELRCIIGPNGAGKTTMMDVITGKTRPEAGEAHFGNAHDLTRMSEPEIARAGIGRKFQKPTIFKNHSVFENLEVALKTDKRVFPVITSIMVVLPAPFGPMMQRNSPGSMMSDSPARALNPSKLTLMPSR